MVKRKIGSQSREPIIAKRKNPMETSFCDRFCNRKNIDIMQIRRYTGQSLSGARLYSNVKKGVEAEIVIFFLPLVNLSTGQKMGRNSSMTPIKINLALF